jgi:hypothetical protein
MHSYVDKKIYSCKKWVLHWHDSKSMVRQVKNSHMKELSRAILIWIHDNMITWRKVVKMF